MIIACIVLKINFTITILYFRKYLIGLHKRMRNEAQEKFLSHNSSFNYNNNNYINFPPLEQSSSYGLNWDSLYGEEKNTFNALKYLKNNMDAILTKTEPVNVKYHSASKTDHYCKSFHESPDINDDGALHDRFDTPKKITRCFSSCLQD